MTQQVSSNNSFQYLVLWFTYILYLLFAPALIGLGISYVATRFGSRGMNMDSNTRALLESHHQWLMRTFVFVSAFVMAGIGTAFSGFGFFIAGAAIVWWFYRVIKGMVAFATSKSMPA